MNTRPIAVYVSRHDRPGRKPIYTAYTYWFNPAWKSGKVYTVEARNGTEAKKLAIKLAKEEDASRD